MNSPLGFPSFYLKIQKIKRLSLFYVTPFSLSFFLQKALEAVPQDDLEAALSKASMPNKTVIITIVNKAYVEGDDTSMLDLFLESFWIGEGTREMADHLLVVAGDQTAYDRCIFRGLHCYKMVGEDGDMEGEKLYMSEDFIKMMWRRTLLLLHVLERGYSFIFTVRTITKRHRFGPIFWS